MELRYNSRFFSLLLIGLLSFSASGLPSLKQEYENITNCRAINYNEERVGVSVTGFNGKSIDVSRLISSRTGRGDLITSVRIQASPDTSAMARFVVDGRSSDWFSPKIYRDYGDNYTVYCFDDIFTRADSDIEVQFNSGRAKPSAIILFVRRK